jgi:chemotaxis protein methyltransferase CheR
MSGLLGSSLQGQVGLRLDRPMRARLDQLVDEEAGARGLSVERYAMLVRDDAEARQRLIDRLVVPTTRFFRHPEQLEGLARLLPDMAPPVTVWSAGCSHGQEPYSVAMLLAERGVADWRVIASDVSTASLERAAAGRYEERELEGLDSHRRRRFLKRAGGGWSIAAGLRDRVAFLRHNLVTEDVPPAVRDARAVLCRNVLIYMEPAAQRALLDRLASRLPFLHVLIVGATESLWGATERFEPVVIGDAYVYRPASAPGRPPPPVDRRPAAAPVATPSRAAARPDPRDHVAEGEAALAAGDAGAAAAAFRRACYLEPDDPLSHFRLGVALERAGAPAEARRAYAAALTALRRRGEAAVVVELEGFTPAELARHIEGRLRKMPPS